MCFRRMEHPDRPIMPPREAEQHEVRKAMANDPPFEGFAASAGGFCCRYRLRGRTKSSRRCRVSGRARPALRRCAAARRVVSPARGGLPPRSLRGAPRQPARPDRGHARRARSLRRAPRLRGRRRHPRARAHAGPDRVGGGGPAHPPRIRPGDHRLGGREPDAGLDEPGAPRPARRDRPGHACRARGADLDSARCARLPEGCAQHLPHRQGRVVRRRRVRAGQVVRRRGRARARQRPGACHASSTRRRRTR